VRRKGEYSLERTQEEGVANDQGRTGKEIVGLTMGGGERWRGEGVRPGKIPREEGGIKEIVRG